MGKLFVRIYLLKMVERSHKHRKQKVTIPTQWAHGFLKCILDLLTNIWTNRNQTIHGKTIQESKTKARELTIQKIKVLYQHPPKLASRFPPINAVPLEIRIRRTNQQLKDWLTWIEHQKKVTSFLNAARPPGQLTIHQAFKNALDRHSDKAKYPPWIAASRVLYEAYPATSTYPQTWLLSVTGTQKCVKVW